mgnify:CR=1 FL=1
MSTVEVKNIRNEKVGEVELNDQVFNREVKTYVLHDVVRLQRAARRAGTASTKTRKEVRGSGAKPWRQKGTGRARAGTRKSPIWRGGGRTFAATPRDHAQKVNRKMYRGAMQAILSELLRQDRLIVVERLELAEPKTKALLEKLAELGFEKGLIVLGDANENVYLASRNIPGVYTIDVAGIDPVSLVGSDKVVLTVDAVEKIQEWLG